MKNSIILQALIIISVATVSAFAPIHSNSVTRQTTIPTSIFHPSSSTTIFTRSATFTSTTIRSQSDDNEKDGLFTNLSINPIYAAPYLVFLIVATYMSINEAPGASQAIIEKFIADPLHPNSGSALFEVVFNTLGLIGLPMACLIMPGAKNQKFSPTPFLFGSAAAGYGSLGLFMMTRKPVVRVDTEELGFFTKNVLENKIFNWVLFFALANTYIITGAGEGLITNAGAIFQDFQQVLSQSALGLVSTLDLTILCLTGASLVPEDLERRGVDDKGKAYAIAASTLLVPAVGLALYSALRPSLDSDGD
jgi:hypothetical protein